MIERLRKTPSRARLLWTMAASVLVLLAGVGVTGASVATDENPRKLPRTVTIDATWSAEMTIHAEWDQEGQFGGIGGEVVTHPACSLRRVVEIRKRGGHGRRGREWLLHADQSWFLNPEYPGTYRAYVDPEINFYDDRKEGRQVIFCKGAISPRFEVTEDELSR